MVAVEVEKGLERLRQRSVRRAVGLNAQGCRGSML